MKKVDMIIDLQYGSTGKGLIAGYLAELRGYDVVINANMPNAGHTYINKYGRKWIHKVLPNGIVSSNLKYVLIGPGSVFSLDRLLLEINQSEDILKGAEIKIHPSAVVLEDWHVTQEKRSLATIGSTMQGSMVAMTEKMMRDSDHNPLAGCQLLTKGQGWLLTTHEEYMEIIYGATRILAEGAQGFSLGLSERFWPFCTSRDCTPARFLADMSIPHDMVRELIGTCRTYPIRVGGNSGDCYDDQHEMEWVELGIKPERTTVTQKERRIFTFSYAQMRDAIRACRPDSIFLNFCNYTNDSGAGIQEAINNIYYGNIDTKYGEGVKWKGYGATFSDVKEV